MDSSTAVAQKSTPLDLYYQDSTNSLVQAVGVQYDTRFISNFNSRAGGQQSLFIPPSNGINKVVIVIEFLASSLGCLNGGFALPRGWGYQLCSLFSWRISGSQQYFVSGSQLLSANLRKCRTKSQRDAVYSLGGEAITNIAGHTKPVRAYIPLSFFTAPSNDGMDLPIASDILGSQIQITVQMEPPASIFKSNPAWIGAFVAPPTEVDTAYFQTEQLSMNDRAMSLASREGVNMDTETYIQSLRDFTQQELVAELADNATLQTLTINGFMSGQVRALQIFLTESNPSNPMYSSLNWEIPDEVVCIFAGQQYAVYRNGTSELFNLIDGTAPNAVDSVEYSAGASGVVVRPAVAKWCILPFSQPTHNDYEANIMVSGLRITNGSVQLQMRSPDASKKYTVHVVPILNSALAYSRGSATLLIG